MNTDTRSGFVASIGFHARRTEYVSTGENMLWSFKETAPADTMIMEIDRPVSVGRFVEKFQNIATMHFCSSTFLRLTSSSAVSQLVEETFNPKINACKELISIIFEGKFRHILSTCKDTAVFILMSFRAMADANINAPVSQGRSLNCVPTWAVTEIVLHASRRACGYAAHNKLTWPMPVTKIFESFI
jgi:hypothetical protein